jgi:hypothetical protein
MDVVCSICGTKEVIVYHTNPSQTFCPACCPDHDYQYERWERAHICTVCGEQAPADLFDHDDW